MYKLKVKSGKFHRREAKGMKTYRAGEVVELSESEAERYRSFFEVTEGVRAILDAEEPGPADETSTTDTDDSDEETEEEVEEEEVEETGPVKLKIEAQGSGRYKVIHPKTGQAIHTGTLTKRQARELAAEGKVTSGNTEE